MAVCQFCKQQVRFAFTKNGRKLPVDWNQNPDGNVEIEAGVAHVLTKEQLAERADADPLPRWMPHFASCDGWARRRAEEERIDRLAAAAKESRQESAEVVELDKWRERADLR